MPEKLLSLLPVSWSEEEEEEDEEEEDEESLLEVDEDDVEADSSPEDVEPSTASFSHNQDGGFDSTKNPWLLRTLYRLL